ncbi:HAD family hydrolase [Sphingobacterium sp. SG20118]|uniref:HAD family hydrolase n=1 Tax=Sphingobacterium sp. SG20118 TaxID=3367156 RepID=UPI0037DFC299
MRKTAKKAIIFDLDNTIYPVSSIAGNLFSDLFKLIEQDGRYIGSLEAVKDAIQRRPFQVVANEFDFNQELTAKALEVLSVLEYRSTIRPFEDYQLTKELDCLKFLVTTGFTNLQWSKIKQLELEKDFEACFVVDPAKSDLTKKNIFAQIMVKYNLSSKEVLVVGDDIHSEIKAGRELGIETVLYDYAGKHTHTSTYNDNVISNFDKLITFV